MNKLNLLDLRCTVFAPLITYSNDSLGKLLPLFNKEQYTPSILPQLVQPTAYNNYIQQNNVIDQVKNWQLISPVCKESISFINGQIDIKLKLSKIGEIKEEDFCNSSFEKIQKILKVFGFKAFRMAFAPSYSYEQEQEERSSFIDSIFSKNSFHETKINSCSFSNVFKTSEEIFGHKIMMNFVSQFDNGQYLVSQAAGGNSIKDCFYVRNDINTIPNPAVSFNLDDVADFFKKAANFNTDFLNFYINK